MRGALLLAAAVTAMNASHARVATAAFDQTMSAPEVGPRPTPLQSDMDARLARVDRWLRAVMHHRPGSLDDAAMGVGAWSAPELRLLWIDTHAVVRLIRNPRTSTFSFKAAGQRSPQDISYPNSPLQRLRALACAAGGQVGAGMRADEPRCVDIDALKQLDGELRELARRARESRLGGDDNYILRRGAILQADVAMLAPARNEPIAPSFGPGPDRFRMSLADGQGTAFRQVGVHWELARMLLDYVKPRGAEQVAPGRDDMVRDWYRATAAWMQDRQDYDSDHLARAREVFPTDPVILFLSGSQAEIFAAPHVQSAVRSAVVPSGTTFAVGSDRSELHKAEGFYRRAVAADGSLPQLKLRFGHVLLLLERQAEASGHLREALEVEDDPLLRYYGELFLGAALERLGNGEAARQAYTEAAALYPNAQSPHLAMSALARRRGDRATALREMQAVFELQDAGAVQEDPWWTYYKSHARDADDLLKALWRPFLSEVEP